MMTYETARKQLELDLAIKTAQFKVLHNDFLALTDPKKVVPTLYELGLKSAEVHLAKKMLGMLKIVIPPAPKPQRPPKVVKKVRKRKKIRKKKIH